MEKNEILTGIRFYQYHIYALILFSLYSTYHFLFGDVVVGIILSMAAISISALVITRVVGRESRFLRELSLFFIVISVLSACYYLGLRGLVWVFPLIIGIFFNYSIKAALIYSVLAVFACLLAATRTLDTIFIVRMIFPLSLTIGFAYLYRATIVKERLALEKEANEDYLTGIYNRRSFQNWLKRAATNMAESEQFLAVFYLDIDNFKHINDNYGHEAGDKVLTEISRRLVKVIRPTDMMARSEDQKMARIAGDEFVIATGSLKNIVDAEKIAERLLTSINKPVLVDGLELDVSASIGVALSKGKNLDVEQLMQDADAAMFKSKDKGKNRITFFDEEIAITIQQKKLIARGLEVALRNEEFYLNFMPIFSSDGASLAGAEVLIRCTSDALKGIGPDKYIPVAEESGLIRSIDLFVIEHAFEHLAKIQDKVSDAFTLAINISAKELVNEAFPGQLEALAQKYNIRSEQVELELTETSLVSMDESSIAMLNKIKAGGFRLSLDDFGTGYTAFSQLQHYPVDTLKIDRSFVWSISEHAQQQKTMVDVILSLAKLYQVKVIAEGVENQVQLAYLQRANCDYFQGFYLSKPLAWDAFCRLYVKS